MFHSTRTECAVMSRTLASTFSGTPAYNNEREVYESPTSPLIQVAVLCLVYDRHVLILGNPELNRLVSQHIGVCSYNTGESVWCSLFEVSTT